MTVTTKFLVWLLCAAFVAFIWGYCASLMPDAMHAETMNQRAIAAGQWKHQRGYYEYMQFTEANNAQ